jgi:hypothetical protein
MRAESTVEGLAIDSQERVNILLSHFNPVNGLHRRLCRDHTQEEQGSKIVTAAEAIAGIEDGIVLAVRTLHRDMLDIWSSMRVFIDFI